MKISTSWLKKYVDFPTDSIMSDLSLHTAEVEEIEYVGGLDNVVIGHVITLEAHPDADKLRVAQVDVGHKEHYQIVCGAKNLEQGMKVPVALPGAKLPAGFEIQPTPLRGVTSNGMICSQDELGLQEERAAGIMVLPDDAPIGANVMTYLGKADMVLEIDNKSITNRPDLFGHYGIARELSVLHNTPLKPVIEEFFENDEALPALSIKVDAPETIRRFMAVQIDNIQVTSSPLWLKTALENIGERSVNSIVDVTNFIMFDLGQPMHAFDTNKLKTKDLSIGFSKYEEQEVETLDHEKRSISKNILLMKDGETPIGIIGIMGLKESEVSDETNSIVLIVDTLDPQVVRKGVQELGLRSQGSQRQEKGLDPEMTYIGLQKALHMLKEIHPECVISSQFVDIYPTPTERPQISISYDFIDKHVGEVIERAYIKRILSGLGCIIEEGHEDELLLTIPSWRATGDLSLKEDIIEEIVRIYGYDTLQPQTPVLPIVPQKEDDFLTFLEEVRTLLATQGHLLEVNNYSFYSRALHEGCLLTTEKHNDPIAVLNPISKELEIMRTSMIPLLCEDVLQNLKHTPSYGAFECDRIFIKENGRFTNEEQQSLEQDAIGLIIGESKKPEGTTKELWLQHPFYHLKKIVADLCSTLHISSLSFVPITTEGLEQYPWAHPKKSALIYSHETLLGVIGEIHPAALHYFGKTKIALVAAELNPKAMLYCKSEPLYSPVTSQPPVMRDLSIVLDQHQHIGPILEHIKSFDALIREVKIFDIYEGDQLPADKKSITTALTFTDSSRTLKDTEITDLVGRLVESLRSDYAAELR